MPMDMPKPLKGCQRSSVFAVDRFWFICLYASSGTAIQHSIIWLVAVVLLHAILAVMTLASWKEQ